MYIFYFSYLYHNNGHQVAVVAESVNEAKAIASELSLLLKYTGDYDEVEQEPFEGQEIAWICSTPADELPFIFKWGKKLALLLAYGTNCQCCLGYRIMAGIVLGSALGYLLGA